MGSLLQKGPNWRPPILIKHGRNRKLWINFSNWTPIFPLSTTCFFNWVPIWGFRGPERSRGGQKMTKIAFRGFCAAIFLIFYPPGTGFGGSINDKNSLSGVLCGYFFDFYPPGTGSGGRNHEMARRECPAAQFRQFWPPGPRFGGPNETLPL